MITSSGEYQRGLVVVNPAATSTTRMLRQVAALKNILPITQIESSREPAATRESISNEAEIGDIIIGVGGDGFSNMLGNIMMQAVVDGDGLAKLPFVPTRGGYANDGPSFLNGHKSLTEILEQGRLLDFHPLEITVTSLDGESRTHWGMSSFGIGGTGDASRRIEEVKSNSGKLQLATGLVLARKAIASWERVAHYPEMDFIIDEQELRASDHSIFRGDQVAKYCRPHADPTKPFFEAVTSNPAGYKDALNSMLKMRAGKLFGEMLSETTITVRSDDGKPVKAHEDGEYYALSSPTTVRVRIAPDNFKTLETR